MCWRFNRRLSSKEGDFLHRIVLEVAGPKHGVIEHGTGSDQRVGQFNPVTVFVLPHIITGHPPDRAIDRDADKRFK